MKKKMALAVCLMTAISIVPGKISAAPTAEPSAANLIINGGFETVTELKNDHPMVKQLAAQEWTFDVPVRLPVDWGLNPYGRNGAYRLIADPGVARSGKHCVYVTGDLGNRDLHLQ